MSPAPISSWRDAVTGKDGCADPPVWKRHLGFPGLEKRRPKGKRNPCCDGTKNLKMLLPIALDEYAKLAYAIGVCLAQFSYPGH